MKIPDDRTLNVPGYGLHTYMGDKQLGSESSCLGPIKHTTIRRGAARFVSKVNPNVLPEAVEFYLRFLGQVFDDRPFTGRLAYGRKNGGGVKILGFEGTLLKPYRGNPYKTLVYLTALRYTCYEYGTLVNHLYKHLKKAHTLEDRFRIFQQIHLDQIMEKRGPYRGAKIVSLLGGLGHCLLCPSERYGASASEPISLERFRSNLKNGKIRSVQSHFA
jgi:hypothetical protein